MATKRALDDAMHSNYDFPEENVQNSSQYIGDSCGAVRESEVLALRRLYLAQQAQLRALEARLDKLEREALTALPTDTYAGGAFH